MSHQTVGNHALTSRALQARLSALSEMALDGEDTDGLFDAYARLAMRLCGADRAFVSFPVQGASWLKGAAGSHVRRTPTETLCHHALDHGDVLHIADLAADPRFNNGPLMSVYAPHTAYAAAPVQLEDGLRLGTVCVVFNAPHSFSETELDSLRDLATTVTQLCERRRAHARLLRARKANDAADAMVANFIDHAPMALALLDRDLRFMRVSPRWREELRLIDAPVVGRHIEDVFPGSTAAWGPQLHRVLAGESFSNDAVEAPDGEGNRRWVRADLAPWRGPDGEIAGVLTTRHDITAMVSAMKATEVSEQRLKLAVEIGGVLVFDWDGATGETFRVGRRELMAPPRVLTNATIDQFVEGIHPDDVDEHIRIWREARVAGQTVVRSTYRQMINGAYRWIQCVAEITRDAEGRARRVLGILGDVTTEMEAGQTLIDARNRAEAANRAKSEFLANMSHEIRTPLNGVLGVAGALAATRLDPRQQEMVGLIETSAASLERLLSDILDLSRVESGHTNLVIEPFELMEVMLSVTALFEPRAREKGVRFIFEPALDSCDYYRGDGARIRQILSNLLSNAIKFTSEGTVMLSTASVPGAPAGYRRLRFAVSDTGVGFRPEDKERLFQRFEQADGSVTRRFGGSGLGLAISRALAEQMGGHLDAERNPGAGSTFSLTLDLEITERPGADLQPITRPAAATRPLKVLLAEDHPANQRVVELILQAINADLTTVENGAEAVAAARACDYDVILMDIQMPVMDGLSAIRAIRDHETLNQMSRTPILALTANAMPEHVENSLAAGADGHITKPIRAPALLQAVTDAGAEPAAGHAAE